MRSLLGILHRAFGNFGWPIAEKEARAQARRVRYFWLQLVYLIVLGLAVVIAVGGASSSVSPESLSRQLFSVFFVIQNCLIFVIFPAFAATCISSERAEKSFDLLLTTDLRPSEIVWGKFLGILGNCCTFLLAALPLLAVCILFGGVSIGEAIDNYVLLLVQAALIAIYGISVSAGSQGNLRAIVGTYLVSGFVGFLSINVFSETLYGYGAQELSVIDRCLRELSPSDQTWALAAGICGTVLLFAFCFVTAVQRLTPPEGNRSTPLRVLFSVGLTLFLAAAFVYYNGMRFNPAFVNNYSPWLFPLIVSTGILTVFILPIFAGDRVETPRRVDLFRRRHPLMAGVAWLFLPGGMRGVAFAWACCWLAFGVIWSLFFTDVALSIPYILDRAADSSPIVMLGSSCLGIVLLSAMNCSLAFLLSTCEIRGLLNWALVVAVGLLLNVYPLVFVIGDHARSALHGYSFSFVVVWQKIWNVKRGETAEDAWALFHSSVWVHSVLVLSFFALGCLVLLRRKVSILRIQAPRRVTSTER